MTYKCKICGGNMKLVGGSSTALCEYCGTMQTVPSADNEKKLTLFSRANRLRIGCEFDKASGVYEAIVADFPEEAEAYWGLVLCKYGIEYVDDPATGKKVPTCHRSSFNSIMEDEDFEQTLENADTTAKKLYREEAKKIEELRKGIIAVSAQEEPYDIFICYKETDERGERTLDSVLAQDIYDALTEKKYRVFFARITLEDKLGQEYESHIFAALNSAKVMLVVGTDYEYYHAVWVKNEWSRYLKLMAEDHNKHLIPCYKGIDAYDMPREFAKLQAQDLGKVGAIQDLLRGIDKLVSPTASTPVSAPKGAEIGPLLTMGGEALEKGEWTIASSRFDLALTVDPMCAEAYLGKLMAEFKCKKREQLACAKKSLNKSVQYKQAIAYADDKLKQELEDYCRHTKKRFRQRIILLWLVIAVVVGSAATAIELNYRSIINDFYSGTLDVEAAYAQLDQWSWYQKPDAYTQFLIKKRITEAYPGADNPTSITIPDGVTSIGDYTFNGCTRLTSITLPNSVTNIGHHAFEGCTGLTSITLPDSVTSIGHYAFEGCTGLTSITIPGRVTSIGYYAFEGCTELTSVVISDGVTSIGNRVFSNCTGLTSITIPGSVTSIGDYAFEGCTGLTSIALPDSVTSIGHYAFNGCTELTSIAIPNSVTSIGELVFKDCGRLTSITIPNSMTSIGNRVFHNCTGLTSITIPGSVTSIGDYAFEGCTGLTSITIPGSVTSIGYYAFEGCTELTSVVISDGVTSIGNRVFSNCTGLTSITLPDSVTSIGDYAFEGCTGLTSIAIPESVTSIGNRVFSNCKRLTSINVPGSVTSIGYYAFEGCTGLTSVVISNGVTSIGDCAFKGCTGLTSITIPDSVTSIGNRAFFGCTGLERIYCQMFTKPSGWHMDWATTFKGQIIWGSNGSH